MKKRVLIVCTGNSARSQMAEGILRWLARDSLEVSSAGTKPVGVNPLAIEVMREVNIDISSHRSKSLNKFLNEKFDTVITVCDRANESCPVLPGAPERIHFSFEDPARVQGSADEKRQAFRRTRDELIERLRLFLAARARD